MNFSLNNIILKLNLSMIIYIIFIRPNQGAKIMDERLNNLRVPMILGLNLRPARAKTFASAEEISAGISRGQAWACPPAEPAAAFSQPVQSLDPRGRLVIVFVFVPEQAAGRLITTRWCYGR